VYDAVLRWVKHDEVRRCSRLDQLLQAVRCHFLTPQFLTQQLNSCSVLQRTPVSELLFYNKNNNNNNNNIYISLIVSCQTHNITQMSIISNVLNKRTTINTTWNTMTADSSSFIHKWINKRLMTLLVCIEITWIGTYILKLPRPDPVLAYPEPVLKFAWPKLVLKFPGPEPTELNDLCH